MFRLAVCGIGNKREDRFYVRKESLEVSFLDLLMCCFVVCQESIRWKGFDCLIPTMAPINISLKLPVRARFQILDPSSGLNEGLLYENLTCAPFCKSQH